MPRFNCVEFRWSVSTDYGAVDPAIIKARPHSRLVPTPLHPKMSDTGKTVPPVSAKQPRIDFPVTSVHWILLLLLVTSSDAATLR